MPPYAAGSRGVMSHADTTACLSETEVCAHALDAECFDETPFASHAKQWLKKALPLRYIICLKNLLSCCCGSSQRLGLKDPAAACAVCVQVGNACFRSSCNMSLTCLFLVLLASCCDLPCRQPHCAEQMQKIVNLVPLFSMISIRDQTYVHL